MLASHAITGAMKKFEVTAVKPKNYWAYSLMSIFIGCTSGGFIAPMMIDKPSLPVANGHVFP